MPITTPPPLAEYQPVNLNDAIHRLLHPSYQWWIPSAGYFGESHCPLLNKLGTKRVPTYKDFVLMLGGDPANQASCLRLTQTGYNYKMWGRTLGTPAGPNGRPLCETKCLDEGFWYYGDRLLPLTYVYDPVPNWFCGPSNIAFFYYDAVWSNPQKWKWSWTKQYGYENNGSHMLFTLDPGIYGINLNRYRVNGPFLYIQNPYEELMDAGYGAGDNNWKVTNAIFFVDSPVEVGISWKNRGSVGGIYHTMQANLFRFTPTGYWHL